jgi:hypothetical protein
VAADRPIGFVLVPAQSAYRLSIELGDSSAMIPGWGSDHALHWQGRSSRSPAVPGPRALGSGGREDPRRLELISSRGRSARSRTARRRADAGVGGACAHCTRIAPRKGGSSSVDERGTSGPGRSLRGQIDPPAEGASVRIASTPPLLNRHLGWHEAPPTAGPSGTARWGAATASRGHVSRFFQGAPQMARSGVEPRETLPGDGERPLGTDGGGSLSNTLVSSTMHRAINSASQRDRSRNRTPRRIIMCQRRCAYKSG